MKTRATRRATNTTKEATPTYKKKNRIKGDFKKPKHKGNYKNEF